MEKRRDKRLGAIHSFPPSPKVRTFSNLLFPIFLLCLFTTQSAAAEDSGCIRSSRKRQGPASGTSEKMPVHSPISNPQTNQYEGMDITLADNLAEALGAKATLVRFTWPELNADLLADKFDIAMGGIGRNVARGQGAGLHELLHIDNFGDLPAGPQGGRKPVFRF